MPFTFIEAATAESFWMRTWKVRVAPRATPADRVWAGTAPTAYRSLPANGPAAARAIWASGRGAGGRRARRHEDLGVGVGVLAGAPGRPSEWKAMRVPSAVMSGS